MSTQSELPSSVGRPAPRSTHRPAIGFIGLGAMGGRMAARLLAAGHPVFGWNRSVRKVRPLVAQGLVACASPREVAERADVVLSMVWDSDALRAVTEAPDGLLAGLTPRHVLVDLSTVEPQVSRDIAKRLQSKGAQMLDCPVSGSLDAAQAGTLVLLAGGSSSALERVRPFLEVLGRQVVHLGESHGAGLIMKLAINLQVALQSVAWGEAMIVAESAGITRDAASEAMLASVIASPMLRYRAPFMLAEPAEVWASAAQLRKDVHYALEAAGHPLDAGAHAQRLLDDLCAAGDGDREAAVLMRHVADRSHARSGDQS
ncbi:NAD(P)-dependent oxidoreductase [Streptomyces sp. NPDC006617]|uniref:NAD(P)-dependent oxidoreductase n=1 Tax=Streptomyces sp. NPDC006617 TaxID=3155354 RepID=UPI0033B31706